MFRFFRQIRRKLMAQDQTRRYFLYAFGEIALVVLGILIALQINNWNEARKDRREAQIIIANLNNEFRQNKLILEEQVALVEKNQESTRTLIGLMNKSREEIRHHNPDSLIFWSIEYRSFNPTNSVLSEIIPSGKINLIESDQLKGHLFSWMRELENNKTTFTMYVNWTETKVLDYLTDHIALKNVDQYGLLSWAKPSEFDGDYYPIFHDRVYENILDNDLYHLAGLLQDYETLAKIIDSIIDQTSGMNS
jgi:hypothetical protein